MGRINDAVGVCLCNSRVFHGPHFHSAVVYSVMGINVRWAYLRRSDMTLNWLLLNTSACDNGESLMAPTKWQMRFKKCAILFTAHT